VHRSATKVVRAVVKGLDVWICWLRFFFVLLYFMLIGYLMRKEKIKFEDKSVTPSDVDV